MTNRFAAVVAVVTLTLATLSGCSMAYGSNEPLVTQDVQDSEATLEALRWADTINLQKKVLSINDVYDVSADGVNVGQIRGQYIYLIGDTHSLFTPSGNLVASEGEKFRFVTHGAALYDYNNQPIGELSQNFTMFLKNWTILDAAGEPIGEAKGEWSLTFKFTVLNDRGEPEYLIEKAVFSIGAQLTITRVANEPTIPVMNAIWLATISNEIHEAERERD